MPQLKAQESLRRIMEIGSGTGSLKNARSIKTGLVREAQERQKAIPVDSEALASMGIGVQRCQKN